MDFKRKATELLLNIQADHFAEDEASVELVADALEAESAKFRAALEAGKRWSDIVYSWANTDQLDRDAVMEACRQFDEAAKV
jgi:hypothetical protein